MVNRPNSSFMELITIVTKYREHDTLPRKDGVRAVKEIRDRIIAERSSGISATVDELEPCLLDPQIQRLLGVAPMQVTDFSGLLGLKRGKVFGLEFRLMGPAGSHKDLMVGALIVLQLLQNEFPSGVDTFADAGFFNSAFATRHYARRFGLRGVYFIQESTPKNLIEQLRADDFEVVLVPEPPAETGKDKKNATYRAELKRLATDDAFRRRVFHLGHAELGFFATMPYGRYAARELKARGIRPQIFLTSVGAGTTLVGTGEPIQEMFGTEIVVGEYAGLQPVTAKIPSSYVETINSKDILSLADQKGDEAFQRYLAEKGYDIGTTSAGGLLLSPYLAHREGVCVVTPIFEKYRDYKSRSVLSRALQLNPFIPNDFWTKVGRTYAIT